MTSGSFRTQIYPAISNGHVGITGSPADLANSNMTVTNMSGQPVYRLHNDKATTLNLDVTKFVNGMYFLQITNGSRITTQKIIIQKYPVDTNLQILNQQPSINHEKSSIPVQLPLFNPVAVCTTKCLDHLGK